MIYLAHFSFEGFPAHMITREGPLKDAESYSLPGVDASFCRSFSVEPTGKDQETAESSPFMTLEREGLEQNR